MFYAFMVILLLGISSAVPASESHLFDKRQRNPSHTHNIPATGLINPPIRVINQANPVPSPIKPVTSQVNPSAGQVNAVPGQFNPATGQVNPVTGQGQNTKLISQIVSAAERALGHLITDFGLEMSETIYQNGENDTVLFSPLSIHTLMTLLMAGMGKQSKTYFETSQVLGYNGVGNDESLHQLYRTLLNDLSMQNDHVTFSMGNRLFLQRVNNNSTHILGSFTKTAKENYNAGTETLNFFSDPLGAANHINEWVNTSTNGKIPQLLTDPLSPQTKFMAVNTVYFKAPWLSPFEPIGNNIRTFDTGTEKIDMTFMAQIMSLKRHEQISAEFNATIVELPYKGERYSMFIIKPNGPASLNSVIQLEYALDPKNLNFLVETTKSKESLPISLQIPRMRLRYRTYLKDILKKMGATSMFSVEKADFSRITSSNQPILDNMIHEAVMDITEEGTEAAAATSSTHNKSGTSLVFRLDQPSLLFIYDSKTKVPIFWARLVTPQSI